MSHGPADAFDRNTRCFETEAADHRYNERPIGALLQQLADGLTSQRYEETRIAGDPAHQVE
jgi:hypothetical protein